MPRAKTTADLLSELRARVAAPAANGLLSDAELLELADQEMRSELASILIGVRSEYWCTSYTVAITSGVASYRIPDRSLGMGLRDVTIYDASGREWNIPQVDASRRYLLAAGNAGSTDPARAFVLEDGTLTLLPAPSVGGYTLRLRYYVTPPTLTTVANSAAVQSAASATSLLVYVTDTTSEAIDAGSYIDVIRGTGMHGAIQSRLAITSVGGPSSDIYTLTVSPAMTAVTTSEQDTVDAYGISGEAGYPPFHGYRIDYVCIAGTTVYPPLPEILWPCLLSATARSYCEAIGDQRGLEAAAAIYDRRRRVALDVLQPRVDGDPVQVIPLDTPLRGARIRGWR